MKRVPMGLGGEDSNRAAIKAAFWGGIATTVLTTPTAFAQDTPATDKEKATELETIEVTGSRLGRADIEGALPVATITRAEIDKSGFTSVGELLRNTTFNSLGAFRAQSGSSAQALVAVDLRGLGSERTLVLIDGRRAPKAPYAPTAQDLNAVPLAMVERIEVLKDGASAIYGSDAIAGVINIITRKDYTGAEVSYQQGSTDRNGGDWKGGQFVSGLSSERGNIVMGASFFSRDIIFARDSLFNTPGASFFSNNYVLSNFVDANGDYIDDNTGHPYYGAVPSGQPGGGAYSVDPACPNSDPAFYTYPNGLGGVNCGYDFNLVAADEAQTSNQGLFLKGTYKVTDNWHFDASGSLGRAQSFGRYAPSLNDVAIIVPASSPNNPFGDQDIYLYHRFAALGTRDDNTDANVYDLSGSFTGNVGDVRLSAGARHNEYQFYKLGENYVVMPIATQYIIDGTYDIYDPTVNNPTSVLNSMKATITRNSVWKTLEYFGEAKIPLFSLPGGMSETAVGVEYRTERYKDKYDSLSEGGAIGGSSGNSSGGMRKVKSAYAEIGFPIIPKLEVNLSGRYDQYSDVGSNFSPKISARFQPVDMLTLRASAGQGFRAPTLDVVTALPQFSAEAITNDQPTCLFVGGTWNGTKCNKSAQVNTTIMSNPALAPESSNQYGLGVAVDITKNIDFSIDFYKVTLEDRIAYIDPTLLIDIINAGDPVPPGLSITRQAPSNRIVSVIAGFANRGELDTSGFDIGLNVKTELGGAGKIDTNFMTTYILDYKIDSGRDTVGDPGVPAFRATLNNTWTLASLAVALNGHYIDSQDDTIGGGGGTIPSYTTWDAQVAYTLPFLGGAEIAAGAINLFGREPSNSSAADGRDYNFALYDQYGTQPYIKYTQKF